MNNQSNGQQSRNVMIDSTRLNAQLEREADAEIIVEAEMIQALKNIEATTERSERSRTTGTNSTNARRLHESAGTTKQLEPILEQDDEGMLDHNNENDQDAAMDFKELAENKNKFVLKNLNLKQNRGKERHHTGEEEAKNSEQIEGETRETLEITQKEKTIMARANKRRSVMIFSSLAIIIILSTYFVIAYFLAMETFQAAQDVITSLQLVFYKSSCFDSTINFLRES